LLAVREGFPIDRVAIAESEPKLAIGAEPQASTIVAPIERYGHSEIILSVSNSVPEYLVLNEA
jgi:hypothetical protein